MRRPVVLPHVVVALGQEVVAVLLRRNPLQLTLAECAILIRRLIVYVHIGQSVMHFRQPLGAVQEAPLGALDDPAAQLPLHIRQQHAEELLHRHCSGFAWKGYENNFICRRASPSGVLTKLSDIDIRVYR